MGGVVSYVWSRKSCEGMSPRKKRAYSPVLVMEASSNGSRFATRTRPYRSLVATGPEQAVAAERERIASDLHDSVGQSLVCIGLLAGRYAEELPGDSLWADRMRRLASLADQGKWEIDQAIRAMTFMPAGSRGLTRSLRELARSFGYDSGIEVVIDIALKRRVNGAVGRALYRVAHEALSNAWRHSRCAVIRLSVENSAQGIRLRVTDDGIGLGPRTHRDSWIGIRGMKRALESVGGRLRVVNKRPRGVTVEALVPVGP